MTDSLSAVARHLFLCLRRLFSPLSLLPLSNPVADTLVSLDTAQISAVALPSLTVFTRLKRLRILDVNPSVIHSSCRPTHFRLSSLTLSPSSSLCLDTLFQFVCLTQLELSTESWHNALPDIDVSEISRLPLLSSLHMPYPSTARVFRSLASSRSLRSLSLYLGSSEKACSDFMQSLTCRKLQTLNLQLDFDDWSAALAHIASMLSLRELTVMKHLSIEELSALACPPNLPNLLTVTHLSRSEFAGVDVSRNPFQFLRHDIDRYRHYRRVDIEMVRRGYIGESIVQCELRAKDIDKQCSF